jgi:hypothetical protein
MYSETSCNNFLDVEFYARNVPFKAVAPMAATFLSGVLHGGEFFEQEFKCDQINLLIRLFYLHSNFIICKSTFFIIELLPKAANPGVNFVNPPFGPKMFSGIF